MGLFNKIKKKDESSSTPKSVYNYRVYGSACISAFAAVMIGYDSAFIGTTISLNSFRTEFKFDEKSDSEVNTISANIVSLYQAGCFFGALFAYLVGQLLGRKIGLMMASTIFVLGAGLMLGANGDRGLGLLYGGRVIAGWGIGMASGITPIYIAEIAPPIIRGRLIGMYELGWQVGGLVGFWINYGVEQTMPPDHTQWLVPFAIQLIPGGIMAIGSFWIKESPRWLLMNDRREEAIHNLCWVRNLEPDHPYLFEEIAAMDEQHHRRLHTVGNGFLAPFKTIFSSKELSKRLLLAMSLFFWQNGSGINAINYYSPTVFQSIGIQGSSSKLLSTGIFGVLKTVVTLVWLFFLIDNLGRRTLLIAGAIGGGLCMYAVGAYIAIAKPEDHPSNTISGGGIAAMFFIYLWTIFYTPSWNGTPWVFCAEIFDQNIRTLTQSFVAASNWFWNFIISRFTPQMFSSMGYGVFLLFASLMILSAPYTFFLVPETRRLELEYMDQIFKRTNGQRPWNAHKRVMAEIASSHAAIAGANLSSESDPEKAENQQVEFSK